MHEHAQLAQLKRMRMLATGLLVAMALLFALLFVISRSLEYRVPALAFLSAFAEAAMVGGLADWFAVTALFRAPLGLRIPHTAIIPKNKDRIGAALSEFIQHNFMTRDIIRNELRGVDFIEAVALWLSSPANSRTVARWAAGTVPLLLEFANDEEMQSVLLRHAESTVKDARIGPALAEIVSALAAKGHHQELFAHLVDLATDVFEHNKPYIRWKIHEDSPRWVPKAVDEKIYERLLHAIRSTLDEMREDDSEWRMRFQQAVDHLTERLKASPEYESRLAALLREVFRHPAFDDYVIRLWQDAKARLSADAIADDSIIAATLEEITDSLTRRLQHDVAMRIKLNDLIGALATEIVVTRREFIAGLISRVIEKWDADTMSRRLELQIGKDLQYIRINGTLVGGLVGLVLHALTLVPLMHF